MKIRKNIEFENNEDSDAIINALKQFIALDKDLEAVK